MADQLEKTAGYPATKRMSALFKGTFAYTTVKERMPKILTQVIDTVHKEEARVKEAHGQAGTDDVKAALAQLSELRNQMETNKEMTPILTGEDLEAWNTVFEHYRQTRRMQGKAPQWFTVSWLFAECYMYRKIYEILQGSKYLKEFDPFAVQKQVSFAGSIHQIESLATYTIGLLKNTKQDPGDLRIQFEHLLLLCLWGNKVDLSMMASVDTYDASQDHLSSIDPDSKEALRTNILADHSAAVWDVLELVCQHKSGQEVRRIDFVLDNAGFEITSDLCLAEWLLTMEFADRIHFHCKSIPWFVSDATRSDFSWTLEKMAGHENPAIAELGKKWQARVREGTFGVTDHPFWTTSFEYATMQKMAPDLYSTLSQAHLIFFKGDLNYRKLLADRNWHYTESFGIALGGFQPTNICALRTLKADLVTGLPPGAADRAATENKDWMITGQYAVLQLHTNTNKQ